MLRVSCSIFLLASCSSATPELGIVEQESTSINMPDASKNSMPADNSINDIAPARDGNIAIIEEFEAAKTKNTIAAYDLFIARHPDHELVAEAKKLRLNVRTSPVK